MHGVLPVLGSGRYPKTASLCRSINELGVLSFFVLSPADDKIVE